jgi:hypothetical protein
MNKRLLAALPLLFTLSRATGTDHSVAYVDDRENEPILLKTDGKPVPMQMLGGNKALQAQVFQKRST